MGLLVASLCFVALLGSLLPANGSVLQLDNTNFDQVPRS